MIILDLRNKQPKNIVAGGVVHLRINGIYEQAPGKWRLVATDVTPLLGAEPTGYACLCGWVEPAKEDGSLPEGWIEKTFPKRHFFLCPECQEDVPVCRVCGCSNEDPCEGGCQWVEEDLCSACVGEEGLKKI